ncbi:putative protein kinase RLK-Pelle-WAK family [Helianthus anomalus]
MILVLENFSNGFLGHYLVNFHSRNFLTGERRLKIGIDVAHALNYIHSKMEGQKMTSDRSINSYDIGLDENWRVKIVDFGDYVIPPPNQEDEALYLKWIGGPSYTDAKYKKTPRLKRESVVYSFGVILFEILCGWIAYDPFYKKEGTVRRAPVATRSYIRRLQEGAICSINKEIDDDSLDSFMKIAYQCVRETHRPTMKVVVKELEKALFFQVSHCSNFISLIPTRVMVY